MNYISSILLLLCSVRLYAQDSIVAKIPFNGYDLSWVNGQNREKQPPLVFLDASGETVLTGVVYTDAYFNYDFNRPIDNTHTISSTIGRSNEFTLNLASIGIESNYKNVIGRLWLQTGNMLHIVQEQDGAVHHGRNTGTGNLKFIREAAAGYHFNKLYGINVEMGIFMSYIGLESYITQENWSYQRSMVCDFTPFYFSGARFQFFPTKNYRTEVWLLNGWQTYNSWNKTIGLGNSNYLRPNENIQLAANFYLGNESSTASIRFHHDNSVVVRYLNHPASLPISQAAFSLNTHYGFQKTENQQPAHQYMTGASLANRIWFWKNKFAITLRGDVITNPGIYLAFSPSPVAPNDFTEAISADPAQSLNLLQGTATFDLMPNDFVTFRLEYGIRKCNIPYFAGQGGTTSPDGWTTTPTGNWKPDLRRTEQRLTLAVNFRL